MIIGYSDYVLSFVLTGSQSPAPAFLNDPSLMDDARCGSATSMTFTGGTQSTAVWASLNIAISSVMDPITPYWGLVGVSNVTLPQGTKLVLNGVTQRLAPNERGEMGAWWLFGTSLSGGSQSIKIYNDVNGSPLLTAGGTFAIGEIFIGRAIQLPTLVDQQMSDDLNDISAYNRSNSQQLYALMRKSWRQYSQTLGRFTVAQARGKGSSTLPDGAGGFIDIQTLRAYLVAQRKCAVIDVPYLGFGNAKNVTGWDADQTIMQANAMIAKPVQAGRIYLDGAPLYSWNPVFQEAL